MDKSYVTMEQHVCIVCGHSYDTGSILLNRRLQKTFDRHTVTGNGLCPEHKKLYNEGYVALIEIDPEKSNARNGETLKLEEAYRTGVVMHIRRSAFERIFNTPLETEDGKPVAMTYIDPQVTAVLKKMMEQTA